MYLNSFQSIWPQVCSDGWLQFKGVRLAKTMVAFGLLMIDLAIKILSYTVRGKSKDIHSWVDLFFQK